VRVSIHREHLDVSGKIGDPLALSGSRAAERRWMVQRAARSSEEWDGDRVTVHASDP